MTTNVNGLFDTHSHINADAFDEDRAQIIEKMKAHNVVGSIVVACEKEAYEPLLALLDEYPNYLYGAWGLHPEYESEWEPTVEQIVEYCKPDNIVAVGETGLDFYWCPTKPEWQVERFKRHIQAAKILNKPLIIHARDAESEAVSILEQADLNGLPFVLHCYMGDADTAKRAVAIGGYVSFTGNLTFKKNDALRETSLAVPLDRLMLETDCPYMAPVPFRGKRCDPTMVEPIAQMHADLRGLSIHEVIQKTTENAYAFFKIGSQR